MLRFEASKYYQYQSDTMIVEGDNLVITPTLEGLNLIARYYIRKYGADISIIDKDSVKPLKIETNDPVKRPDTCVLGTLPSFAHSVLQDVKKSVSANLQRIFILYDDYHTESLIYIRQNNQEAFFIADSIANVDHAGTAKTIQSTTGINTYVVQKPRQSDSYSCHVDALIWARIISAKDKAGNYQLKNLLSYLQENSTHSDGCFVINSLPDQLLVTAQKSEFVVAYSKSEHKPIHKDKTLQQLRSRHETSVKLFNLKKEVKDALISSYLRKKGIRLTTNIEIEFYAEQLETALAAKAEGSDKIREVIHTFVSEARKLILANGTNLNVEKSLFDLAMDFYKSISASDQQKTGLSFLR